MASTSITNTVADTLREQILSGRLVPGAPLREVALAAELKVSRNTMRDALHRLTFDGLAHRTPNSGVTVLRLGAPDAHDIYLARRVVELAALDHAAASSPADLRPLGRALDDLERAASEHGLARLVETDLGFHRGLVDTLESDRLSALVRRIEGQLRLGFSIVAFHDREDEEPGALVREHRALFDLIVLGDLDEARTKLLDHLAKYEGRLLAVIHEREQPSRVEDAG